MRRLVLLLAAAAIAPVASIDAQVFNLSPSDGGGNWLVKCTVIANDAPPTGPCNGAFTTATRVTATPGGWTTVPVVGPAGNAYYISEFADASIWPDSPNENPHYLYTFETTFDVTNPGVADQLLLNALWLDNYWVGWSLNGGAFSAAGISPNPQAPNGENWETPFSLALNGNLFVPGENTLQLQIEGNGRTDGLLVQGTYETAGNPKDVTPEPGTMSLLGTGLVAMVGARRRRRKV
jgi:hypothetical protein